MSDESYTFPEQRFVDAGASSDQVTALRAEFDSGDLMVQRSFVDLWSTMSEGGLRDWLAARGQRQDQAVSEGVADDTDENSDVSTTSEEDDEDESDVHDATR